MNTTKLELTNPNKKEILTKSIPINSISDDSEDESIESNIVNQEKQQSSILYLFIKRYIQQLKLVFQSIISDLKDFKYWQIIIFILFATFNVVFSILDFNSFFSHQQPRSLLKWTNDVEDGKPLWRRILLCFSGISAFTNILYVGLVIYGKISSFFWGITGAILYGIYAFAYGYVGDAQLFVFFFLPMQFIGIYLWSKKLDNKSTTRVKSLKFSGWIFICISSFLLTLLFYYEIPMFSKYLASTYFFEDKFIPHVFDATTNALNVIGQFLLIACYWEQYIIWIFVNIMSIIMYSGRLGTPLDINLLLVWIMLAISSACGLYKWYHRWKDSKHISSMSNIKV
ncbi:unnamed protein product [Rotaria sordida]|uniref:Nicotinamide mononucleotide transporter n=1 Tax=Rotaria sordida TaxID=392033 RepID=A0A819SBZ8_9BILA|nr:unnamed protein product [Rotaria sordida]CAF4067716.1 unnamed protein product [Rotaria sordida]